MNTKSFLLSCLLVDLLEPAHNLSLETQKVENNLSVFAVTKNLYERLKNKLSKDSKLIFKFPCLEKVLSQISLEKEKYCYQNIELQSFNKAKSYVQNQAFLTVSELCNTSTYCSKMLKTLTKITLLQKMMFCYYMLTNYCIARLGAQVKIR